MIDAFFRAALENGLLVGTGRSPAASNFFTMGESSSKARRIFVVKHVKLRRFNRDSIGVTKMISKITIGLPWVCLNILENNPKGPLLVLHHV